MTKKRNQQDATLINIRALKKRVVELERENKKLRALIKSVGKSISKFIK